MLAHNYMQRLLRVIEMLKPAVTLLEDRVAQELNARAERPTPRVAKVTLTAYVKDNRVIVNVQSEVTEMGDAEWQQRLAHAIATGGDRGTGTE